MIAAYIRVSTQEQTLEVQRAEITRWLEGHNIPADQVMWFEDKQTGKNLKRPGFEQLQKALFSRRCDTVLVWKIDRLARSFRDGVAVVTDWVQREIRLVSVTQALDLSGVLGQALIGFLFAFAELELSTMKERQAAGIAAAKKKGLYGGRKPGTTKGDPQLARALRDTGFTRPQIAQACGVSLRTVAEYLKS